MLIRNSAIAFFVCLLAPLMLGACTAEAPKAASMPIAVVQTLTLSAKPFSEKSEFLCTMRSRKSVTLSPNVDGHITQIQVSPGQFVQKGDKIMQIDSRMQSAQTDAMDAAASSAESDLSMAKSTLASLESSLVGKESNVEYTKTQETRYTNLKQEGAVSTSDYDTWKNSHAAAEADRNSILQQIEAQKMTIQKYERSHKQMLASLQAQKEQLRYYQITAPFAGVIGDVPVKVGDHVTSATALTSLTENHPLEAYISVPAEKASAMHEGINVALAGANGDEYGESKVIFVSPTVDPASQTVLVKALYPNSKSELRAEQTVKAVVVWRQKNGISVPTDVVKQAAGKFFVFLAENSSAANTVAKQAEIEVEGIEGSEYQVKSGLKAGDRVITSGIQRLADGMPVTVKAALEKGNESTATNNKLQTH